MPDATTPNYGFTLPTVGADPDTWGATLNANWTALDTDLHTIQTSIPVIPPTSPALAATWHNVTGSRALVTTYTNPKTYPISVMVLVGTGSGGGGTLLGVTVAGNLMSQQSSGYAGNYTTTFQVPAGQTYSVGGGGSMVTWFEMY
jgi:hypothetical protein